MDARPNQSAARNSECPRGLQIAVPFGVISLARELVEREATRRTADVELTLPLSRGAGAMERRDHMARAGLVQTLVELLTSRAGGVTAAELPSDVPVVVAGRILKPLAIKGLVKVEEDRWIPSPALLLGLRLPLERE